MKIQDKTVVSINYTLSLTDGTVVDSSAGGDPLTFMQGSGEIIPGLEQALEGRATGDSFKVTIPAAQGYGQRNEDLVRTLPRDVFEGIDQIEPGMQFQAQTPHGGMIFTVIESNAQGVKVDGNHPMAGKDLVFDISVENVREATPDELAALEGGCGTSGGCGGCSGCGH